MIRTYWDILGRYKWSIVVCPVLVLVFVVCETLQPMLMARIVDDVTVIRVGHLAGVIWRDCDTVDNDALNDFFRRMSYSTRDTEFDRIYVNGDNNLENLRTDEEQWKVVLTEQEFAKRMFEDC